MATIDLRRVDGQNEKKSISVAAGTLVPAKTEAGGVTAADVVELVNLPADCVVTNACIVVKKAPTGGTQTLSIKVGSTVVVAAIALGTTDGAIKGGAVTRVGTGTGAVVSATVGVAGLTDGEFELVVEYVEYTKTNGELTKV